MIKRNQRVLNIVNGITDALLNFLALFLAYWLRFTVFRPEHGMQPFSNYFDIGILNAAISVLLYTLFRLYEPKRQTSFGKDGWIILRANVIDILFLGLLFFLRREIDFSRWLLFFYFFLSTAFVTLKHSALWLLLQQLRRSGRNLKHIVLIGSGRLAYQYVQALKNNPQLGYHLAGVIASPKADVMALADTDHVGGLDELATLLGQWQFDEAILALEENEVQYTKEAIEVCNLHGIRFSVIPYFTAYCFASTSPDVQTVGAVQVLDICASPLDSVLNRFCKRSVDLLAAILIAVVTSPIMLVSALLVKLTSRGPMLFKQERVGLKKQTFNMYKFRSMKINAAQDTGWSQKDDDRVTIWGKFMRKTSIDELPQLFNIIKGDMSLVGPRPEIPFHVNHFKNEIPYYMARHQIRPGLTGWAQVNGLRGDTSIEKRIQYDLYYIYNWSLGMDIRIIFKTIFGGIISKAE